MSNNGIVAGDGRPAFSLRSGTVATISIILAIVGSIGAASNYFGQAIYGFASRQTELNEHVKNVELGIAQLNMKIESGLEREGRARDAVISGLKEEIQTFKTELAAAKADAVTAAVGAMGVRTKLDDLQGSVNEIKGAVNQSLTLTRSHSDDIETTRKAVDKLVKDAPPGG